MYEKGYNRFTAYAIENPDLKTPCYLFNSSISHEVMPITNGIRYSLIWFIQNDNIKTTPNKII